MTVGFNTRSMIRSGSGGFESSRCRRGGCGGRFYDVSFLTGSVLLGDEW